MTYDLASARRVLDRVLVPALWLHCPLIAVVAWQLNGPVFALAGTAVATAALVSGLWATMANSSMTRPAIAVAAVGMVSLLLAASRGSTWQIDVHLYYFAVLAILAAYCDWVVILVAAAAIAVHHLTLDFIAPALVFPDGADLERVLLHAAIVVLEATALIWMALQVNHLLAAATGSLADAERANDEVRTAQDAQARLQKEAEATRRHTMADVASRLESELHSAITAMTAEAQALRTSATGVASDAKNVAGVTQGLENAANQVSLNVQSSAAGVQQLTASIQEITRQITQAAEKAREADRQAQATGHVMQGLSGDATSIGDVVNLINEIASQTNLLALNATIEAARAGDAGKGFAVVAGEVKDLASQTGRATQQIRAQIEAMQTGTANAVSAIAAIATTIGSMTNTTEAVAAAAEEQQSATAEIARNVQYVAQRIDSMSEEIRTVAKCIAGTRISVDAVAEGIVRMEASASGLNDAAAGLITQLHAA